MRLAIAVLLGTLALGGGSALWLGGADAPGPQWDDRSSDGHAVLAGHLSQVAPVRAIEGSLGLLPRDAGRGDVLFLFPTYRPATGPEMDRVHSFVAAGGTVVLAADGHHAAPWAQRLGVTLHSLPVVFGPHAGNATCVHVDVSSQQRLCLPSPTAFPRLDKAVDGTETVLADVAVSVQDLFLDLDESGDLTLGDQGPQPYAMVVSWRVGKGSVVAVADADLWRKHVVEAAPENLDFAKEAAQAAREGGTIYLDSSSAGDGAFHTMRRQAYHTLAAPGTAAAWALAALVAVMIVLAFLAPRAPERRPHRPDPDASDASVEMAAYALIDAPPAGTPQPMAHRRASSASIRDSNSEEKPWQRQ